MPFTHPHHAAAFFPRSGHSAVGHSTTSHSAASHPHRVSITGTPCIDGRTQSSVRAVELLHLLVNRGPVVSRGDAEEQLYGGYCSRSALWYPMRVCQEAGIAVKYDPAGRSVVLRDEVVFDIDIALRHLAAGDVTAALWMLSGWPPGSANGSYSARLRERLHSAILTSPAHLTRGDIDDALTYLDRRTGQ